MLRYGQPVGQLLQQMLEIAMSIFYLQGTVDRLIVRALLAVDYISDSLSKEQILPLVYGVVTLIVIGFLGYGMSYLM